MVSRRHANRRASAAESAGPWILFSIAALVLLAFYLWGKVQLDLVMHDIDRLQKQKKDVEREIDQLRIEVKAMQSYKRIKTEASNLGLVVLSLEDLEELRVDLEGVDHIPEYTENAVSMAGIDLLPRIRRSLEGKNTAGNRP